MSNILLIQDDPSDAKAVRDALINSSDGSFHVEWVRRCSEGLERLATEANQEKQRTNGIAAVLVDLLLPDSHGIETFDRLFCAAPHIPILILSASQDEDAAKLAVKHGAQDYLLKGRLDSYMLPKAVRSMVERGDRRCVVRRKRARTNHARFHQRRGYEQRYPRQCDLSQCSR